CRERILTLRIGGNDLLSLLRMRRPRGRTIYETPIGQVIARLATTFIPYGFSISAPVFEYLDDVQTLSREIEEDLNHGLLGKTAIHPTQVPLIERHYQVRQQDVEAAMRILHHDAPGVFKLHQSMCEPATHRPWAHSVLEAARCFGSVSAT
ncbi:MAG: HpcH/HpaI aldolase/citrate lyase family protein, partial [Nitrosomonas ureae]